MAHFTYTARSKTGEKASGNVKAPNKAAAIKEVERMGLFPVTIVPVDPSGSDAGSLLLAERQGHGPPAAGLLPSRPMRERDSSRRDTPLPPKPHRPDGFGRLTFWKNNPKTTVFTVMGLLLLASAASILYEYHLTGEYKNGELGLGLDFVALRADALTVKFYTTANYPNGFAKIVDGDGKPLAVKPRQILLGKSWYSVTVDIPLAGQQSQVVLETKRGHEGYTYRPLRRKFYKPEKWWHDSVTIWLDRQALRIRDVQFKSSSARDPF